MKLDVYDEKGESIFDPKHDLVKIFRTGVWEFTIDAETQDASWSNTQTFTLRHGLGFIPLVFPVADGLHVSTSATEFTLEGMGDRTLPLISTGGYSGFFGERITISADKTNIYADVYRWATFDSTSFTKTDYTINYSIHGNVIHVIDYDDISN